MAHRSFKCRARKDIEPAHIKAGDYFWSVEYSGGKDLVVILPDNSHLEITGKEKFDELFEEVLGNCPLDINRTGWNSSDIEPDKEWPILMCSWYDGPNFITGKYSLEKKVFIPDYEDTEFGIEDIDYWMFIPQLPTD